MQDHATHLLDYLRAEGYPAELDEDGDIRFRHEGMTYALCFDNDDPDFAKLILPSVWSIDSEPEMQQALAALDEVNRRMKLVKAHTQAGSVWFTVELLFADQTEWERRLPRAARAITRSVTMFADAMQRSRTAGEAGITLKLNKNAMRLHVEPDAPELPTPSSADWDWKDTTLEPWGMIRDNLENQELTHLLRKFGEPGANGRAAERAQREFYNRIFKTIDLCALQTAKFNHEIAMVAVQETWLQILNTAHKYDPERSSVKTWVQRITQHCTLTELRKHYKQVRIRDALRTGGGDTTEADDAPTDEDGHGDVLSGLVCPVLPHDEVSDTVYQQQVIAAAQACLETLPAGRSPNYRLAMELALDEDLTYERMKTVLQAHMPEDEQLNSERVRKWVGKAATLMRACLGRKLGMGKETTK